LNSESIINNPLSKGRKTFRTSGIIHKRTPLANLSAAKEITGSNGSLIEGMLDHRLTGAMEGNVRRFAFLGERRLRGQNAAGRGSHTILTSP